MSRSPKFTELAELLGSVRDDALTDAQAARLDHLLAIDPEARDYYLEAIDLMASLRNCQGTPGTARVPAASTAEAPRRPAAPARRRRWPWVLSVGLAAAVLLGLVLWPGGPKPPGAPPPADVADAGAVVDGGVAVLTRAVAAEWEPTGLPTTVGASLPPGELKLKSGFAQLEFYGGATVILEGPAEFELLGIDRGFCRKGKLRAKLLPHARGFTIGTPAAELIDRGTEFGVSIDGTGRAEVHVFDGKVELHGMGMQDVPLAQREVVSGRGVRIDPGGGLEPTAARPEAFVGVRELERSSRNEAQRRYHAWKAYSDKLRTDPRLVLYYTFEGQQRWERVVHNQSAGPPGTLDGGIVGCQWVEGRWPEKGALEYKRLGDRVRVHVPGAYQALTLMAWVRVDRLDHSFNGLLLADGFDPTKLHWELNHKGQLIFYVSDRLNPFPLSSPPVLDPDRFGQWVFLASVCDPQTRTVTHYMDGRAVDRTAFASDFHLTIGDAEIGNWGAPIAGAIYPARTFNGRMDEFALFRAALSAEEIRAIFEIGKPTS